MIVRLILYGFFFIANIGLSQNQRYYDKLDRTERDSIQLRSATANKLMVYDFDKGHYSDILLNEINSLRKKKGKKPFEQDSVFNQVCNTSVKHFPLNFFRKKRYDRKIVRYTERSIRHLKGNYRLFRVFTFNINLTTLKAFSRFYYLSKDQSTEIKLFTGRRPIITDPEKEDYQEPEPVEVLTEQEFVIRIIKKMLRSSGGKDLFSKYYSHIGLYTRVDEYTLNRRKIPSAFVMVVIGGKQTQKVKEFNPIDPAEKDPDNPYIILK